MKTLLILALLLASPCGAQVLQLDGGASTLYNGAGLGGTLYTPNSTLYAGIGYGEGRVQFAASDTFMWHGFLTTVGDKQLGFSFDGVGLGLATKGFSIQRKTKHTTITAFVGMTGAGFVTPFITATRAQHAGAGVFLTRTFKDVKIYSLDVVSGGQYTAAQGISYQYRRTITAAASGGLLNGQSFFDGTVTLLPITGLTVYASHIDYFLPLRATGNSAGSSFTYGRFTVQGSINDSAYNGRTVDGEMVGAGVKLGPVSTQANWYKSNGREILSTSATETLHHFTATETMTESAGQDSWSFGGSYTSNRLSISLSHSIVFLLNGEGFQQVTGVQVTMRVHDTLLNAGTVTTPLGKTLWSAYGTNYTQLGIAVPGQTVSASTGGKFLIRGMVKDDKGAVVYGAAIQVGKFIAYTDSTGEFSVREKSDKPQPIAVLPAVFAAPGTWAVLQAPASAVPGDPVAVIVQRAP